jgi:hypothetical protein
MELTRAGFLRLLGLGPIVGRIALADVARTPVGATLAPVNLSPGKCISSTVLTPQGYDVQFALAPSGSTVARVTNNSKRFFCWRSIVIRSHSGPFAIRFQDADGYWLSSDMIRDDLIGHACPFPLFPEIVIPNGKLIGIKIEDRSGKHNLASLWLTGVLV